MDWTGLERERTREEGNIMRTAAIVAGLVLAASVMDVCRAATHPQDIAALWKFKEEALKMSDNNGSWKKVFESWTGRGEACPYPECPHDPCGEDWHGTWHGKTWNTSLGSSQLAKWFLSLFFDVFRCSMP